jgi:UDP-N-acetylglucosamine--N-acetylmuramyl-(pentapeptide) pyrophosphoryl-undecaprenol N-acetylglucosamine transferase
MRIMVTGGGTGGHVFPGIAVAREVLKDPASEVLFVGKQDGPEGQWLKEQGIPFRGIRSAGMPRRLSVRWFTFAIDLLRGLLQAGTLLGRFRPQALFSTGGYASFPASLAAFLRGVPVFLLEPNVAPGLAAKAIGFFARRVFVGFETTLARFPRRRVVHTGIPVRGEILAAGRAESLKAFGLTEGSPTVLIFGGSQGAAQLNQAAADALRFIGEGPQPLQAILMTGRNDYQAIADTLERCPLKVALRQFIPNIHEAYAAADLVVSRAGAMTCAELTARGVPAVLVPYPHAGAHQEANARILERAGAAVTLLEKDLDGESLAEALLSILQDEARLRSMREASRAVGRPGAAADITAAIRVELEGRRAA